MRTLIGGVVAARREPLALVPYSGTGVVAALLVGTGVLPARPVTAPVVAAFPMDLYFDLKHALGHASGWFSLLALLALGLALRSALLAGTLWIADGRPGATFFPVWRRALKLGGGALFAFVPAAVLFFAGVALRYAPFVWVGAALAVLVAVRVARRAAALKVRIDISPAAPTVGGLLLYGYFVSLLGAALWATGSASTWAAALVVAGAAPVHAIFLLGWRAEAVGAVAPGANRGVAVATAVLLVVFAAVVLLDRERGQPAAGPDARENEGSLLLLGGADSTTRTGALVGFDARAVGYRRDDTSLASYRAPEEPYGMEDTRRDLREVASIVAQQVAAADPPVAVLGHSQASVILDHMIRDGVAVPERAAVIAPAPAEPPRLEAPRRAERGPGFAGAALARLLQRGLQAVGVATFDIDAAAAPLHLDGSIAPAGRTPRLAIWALGDSVWLDGDWRRPGETNLVVLTDHVGAVKNPRTIEAVGNFFGGEAVPSDEASWRGALVGVVRFAFEPWRP